MDQVFRSDTWKMQFPEACVKVLTMLDYLDHHPILVALSDNVYMRVPISPKFECAWVVEDSYEDMIKEVWEEESSLSVNLDNIQRKVTQWKLHNIRIIDKKKEQIIE